MVPDVFAEGMAGVAAIRHHPAWHARQPGKQADGLGQLMCLAGYQAEGDGATRAVGDHAGLAAIAAARSAKSFTRSASGSAAPF